VDILIIALFLFITLVVGLTYDRQVKTIKDYALGGKNFSTATLTATIVATYSSGSGFFIELENTYSNGLYYIIPVLGLCLNIWLIGQLAMRMEEFMNKVSITEVMGSMYGRTVQTITACSSTLARIGYIGVQFKVISKILETLFQLDGVTSVCIAAGIAILYSAFGGVKAVTFTDVLQFFTFGTVIPILALTVWNSVQAPTRVIATLANNPLFDLKQVVGWHPRFFSSVGLFFYFAIPGLFGPSVFQRIAMAKNVRQARRSFSYAAVTFLLVVLITFWIGILLLTDMPGLAKEQVVPYMINQYTCTGLKGLLGVGVMALAMSTADSELNAISVIFANDIVRPLMRKTHNSVSIARFFSVVAGILALCMALYTVLYSN